MFVLQEIYAAAAETPDKLAVAFNGRAISYGEFWRLIDARRRQLDALAPESGTVLLATEHILESWLLVLALRSLGLDTAVVRSAEEAALFEGTDVSGLITLDPEPHLELTAPAGARRLHLARLTDGPVSTAGPLGPQPNLRPPGGHILLTSGTTGRHKKIRSTSGEKPDQIRARRERYQELEGHRPTGEDTVSAIFNFGLWTAAGYAQPIFTWCQRGGVVIHQDDDFHRALDWPGLTHATVTPYSLSMLMALPEGAYQAHPDLQLMIVSGSVTPALVRETRRRLTSKITISLASTEAGGWARTVVENDEDLRWYKLDPKRRVEVVDDAGQPLPPGQLGRVRVELRPDGPRGYHGDPESTAAFFDETWFYPGDLGVLDGKGRLALHGRTTDIVHIGGDKHPVEPWERAIQERLECEGVCILSGRWDTDDERLHVFIESRRPISAKALSEALRSTLFGFTDVRVHRVDALPRTGTGKVRRIDLAQQLHEGRYQTIRA
ncbi:MAG: class I adenylate-forming enzyme family protein [Caulobacteraceae bacterium]|nr:class I adenylate-forming enzyme family protein [Caulobacteraceae bacterium]